MAILSTYPDKSSLNGNERLATSDDDGSVKLAATSLLKEFTNTDPVVKSGGAYKAGLLKSDASGNVTVGKATADNLDFATLREVLYTGPSATSGSVTLSKSIMNFSSVEIVTNRSSLFCVTAPRGIVLDRVYSATISNSSGSVITFYSITYRFTSNTTLNIVGGGAVALNSGGVSGLASSNEIVIDSVVGIK